MQGCEASVYLGSAIREKSHKKYVAHTFQNKYHYYICDMYMC